MNDGREYKEFSEFGLCPSFSLNINWDIQIWKLIVGNAFLDGSLFHHFLSMETKIRGIMSSSRVLILKA